MFFSRPMKRTVVFICSTNIRSLYTNKVNHASKSQSAEQNGRQNVFRAAGTF